ncbi:Cysteine-rich RLK 10 [Heracleum sosnowskyi]|uniref:Cysteine-rich RLK 10 n=1 Tax=Heracleum sosnowskyi TaxID=360622 RepID=A0AAD8H410_9APIA|nr:Cysteine-rich RLK 10 [Heracleum sosnowskyi]
MVTPQVLSTSRSLTLRLVGCLVFVIFQTLATAQTYLYSTCPDSPFIKNISRSSQFQTNLNLLLFRSLYNKVMLHPRPARTALIQQLLKWPGLVDIGRKESLGNVYGSVQCTPDLSQLQCQNCISSALLNFANTSICPEGKRGKRILTPSCNIRYEMDLFDVEPPLQPPNQGTKTDNGTDEAKNSNMVAVAISTSVSITLVIVLLGFCACYYNRSKRVKETEEISPENQLLGLAEGRLGDDYLSQNFDGIEQADPKSFPLIRLYLIRTATQEFSVENKLGEGGFGPVYKGRLVDGTRIAVKRLSENSGQGLKEFKAEVTLIAKLQHNNLVKLLGCCLEAKELLLVYDYMPNNSLDVHLFDSTRRAQLDWKRRLSIINGIARGILYLHEDSRLRIIHRDLKASNILLDHDMNPKISDFGMARIFGSKQLEANTNRVVGTYGYMAPEYAMEGIFSVKSDVFSFGVLLLEIVSGKKNCGFYLAGHGYSLLSFAWKLWSDGQGLELMDTLLSETYVEMEVEKCIKIGLLCVQEDPADRPTMSSVIHMLGSHMVPLPQPNEPAFSVGRVVPSSYVNSNDIGSSATISALTISETLPR